MARPLRLLVPGAWYHLTARGHNREPIFADNGDRLHLLDLLAELPERFGVRLYAYVLMRNHFHLLAEPAGGKLSRAMQWLQGSYAIWFNRRHDRCGHFYQGRFKAILLDPAEHGAEVSRYLHLNPVRVRRYQLGKADRARERAGMGTAPGRELVAARLRALREYRWSTYLGLVGAA